MQPSSTNEGRPGFLRWQADKTSRLRAGEGAPKGDGIEVVGERQRGGVIRRTEHYRSPIPVLTRSRASVGPMASAPSKRPYHRAPPWMRSRARWAARRARLAVSRSHVEAASLPARRCLSAWRSASLAAPSVAFAARSNSSARWRSIWATASYPSRQALSPAASLGVRVAIAVTGGPLLS